MNEAASFIPMDIVNRSLARYDINPLYGFLCGVVGKQETERLFRLYQVGTGKKWGGCTVFWQIDIDGNVRAGKLMGYDKTTGHRIKEPQSQVTWAHSAMHLQDYHLVQCLFGEHLLRSYPATPVALVESEKTALIMAHFMPDMVWLATGGKNGCFNANAMKVLSGRKAILFPDLGATDEWREKSQILTSICSQVIVSNIIEEAATDEQRAAGLDIADFFLMEPTKQQLLEGMMRRNPEIKRLVDLLGLEVCDEGVP